jgi:hypothetical protein
LGSGHILHNDPLYGWTVVRRAAEGTREESGTWPSRTSCKGSTRRSALRREIPTCCIKSVTDEGRAGSA